MKQKTLLLLAVLLTAVILVGGCTASDEEHGETYHFIGGASYNNNDGSYVVADVLHQGRDSVQGASIVVNGQTLNYGLSIPISDNSTTILPIYYKEMNFVPGDRLSVTAQVPGRTEAVYAGTVTVPGNMVMTEPPAGTDIIFYGDILTQWLPAADSLFYYLTYEHMENVSDAYYSLKTTGTTGLIPASNTDIGLSSISVSALNGENIHEIFDESITEEEGDTEEALTKSYWLAASYDYRDVDIIMPLASEDLEDEIIFEDTDTRAEVPLRLVQADRVKIDGITFTRRIYDAAQITTAGTIQINLKLEKRHLSIGAVNILDTNQNSYFEWKKVRKYKSKSKRYEVRASIQPYSTVVIHTKTADLNGAAYHY